MVVRVIMQVVVVVRVLPSCCPGCSCDNVVVVVRVSNKFVLFLCVLILLWLFVR